MTTIPYLILGAGPCGLGAAYRLSELGLPFCVLEQSDHPGGLAASFVDDQGFTWDIGGHVQFSHYQYFDQVMQKALGQDGWLLHDRQSWVWIHGRFVPYPFQNNIRYLPQDIAWKCLEGLIDNYMYDGSRPPAHFGEWILRTFGRGIAEEFMMPYNFKVWAFPPEEMAYQWIGERVAVTDLKRVTKNMLLGLDDLSWGPNNQFAFPKKGGTGAIWQRVAQLAGLEHIRLHTSVEHIDPQAKIVHTNQGAFRYEHLLSTLPLTLLTRQVAGLDPAIVQTAQGLKHSTSHIVGVGLKGQPPAELAQKCWLYYPENDCPFYRTTVFSNYSPANVPDPTRFWSMMTETSESVAKPVNRDTLVRDTIQGLINTGSIRSADEVASVWHYTARHGYPTPSLERDQILRQVLPALQAKGVWSRGRFGAWKYEVSNQDHTFMQGVEWANRIALGIPEVTMPFPGTANANWGK